MMKYELQGKGNQESVKKKYEMTKVTKQYKEIGYKAI